MANDTRLILSASVTKLATIDSTIAVRIPAIIPYRIANANVFTFYILSIKMGEAPVMVYLYSRV